MNVKLATLLLVIITLCFVPVVKVTYPVVESIPVAEEYTITEPYTTYEEITIPHITHTNRAVWVDDGSWDYARNYVAFTTDEYMEVFHSVTPGKWVVERYPVIRYTTESVEVIKYREVTKTRTVMKPSVMYKWKHVSLVQGCVWR